jgi:hypothetical protein
MTDLLTLEVLMDFKVVASGGTVYGGSGQAAVRWTRLALSVGLEQEDQARIALAALYYGHVLSIHKETRTELFERVGRVAQELADGAPEANFDNWPLLVGGADMYIWPWEITEPEQMKPKGYVATLKQDSDTRLRVWLNPSSARARVQVNAGGVASRLARVAGAEGVQEPFAPLHGELDRPAHGRVSTQEGIFERSAVDLHGVADAWLNLIRPVWHEHLRDRGRTRPLRLRDLHVP